jgi:hypothetical protein
MRLLAPWAGFLAFTAGQLGMWQLGPYFWDGMVTAGPSTYEVVQDIVHGFDVASIFTSFWWAAPFGLFWYVPMYAVARPRGLVLPLLFGAFVHVYLWLVFLREGDYFGFLSTFRYPGGGPEVLAALVRLIWGLFLLFAGPALAAYFVRGLTRTR